MMTDSMTEIPDRFDHSAVADRIYQAWEAADCAAAKVNSDRKPFTIVIPPPNVTGALHLGHGLNNTLPRHCHPYPSNAGL